MKVSSSQQQNLNGLNKREKAGLSRSCCLLLFLAASLVQLLRLNSFPSLGLQSFVFLDEKSPSSPDQQTRNMTMSTWSDLKVGIFMTTHLSQQHWEFLNNDCWTEGIKRLPLLRDAHLILYTSANVTVDDLNPKLPFPQGMTIRRYNEKPLLPNATELQLDHAKQVGATKAFKDAFSNHWFEGYDWIIRLNPDVLIRKDEWLRNQMSNESIDAILFYYNLTRSVHSDFTVFRPSAVNTTSLFQGPMRLNGEVQTFEMLKHLIEEGRVAWLPDAERNPTFAARVVGKRSPVVHHHDLYKYCPNYFNATQDDFF